MRVKRGTHALVELFGCNEFLLDDILFIKKVLRKAIKESKLIPIKNGEKFHKFNPHGLTGFILLKSSHIAFHSWPEKKYMTLDVFACDEKEKVIKFLSTFLREIKPKKCKKIIFRRGYIHRA